MRLQPPLLCVAVTVDPEKKLEHEPVGLVRGIRICFLPILVVGGGGGGGGGGDGLGSDGTSGGGLLTGTGDVTTGRVDAAFPVGLVPGVSDRIRYFVTLDWKLTNVDNH